MRLEYSIFSEAGVLPVNEDSIRVVEMPDNDRTTFILCDGMGGHIMGDVASRTVASCIAKFWKEIPEVGDCKEKVHEACSTASAAIDRESDCLGRVRMGTTLVMASVEGDKVTIAHMGDSRCYLLRRGYTDWDRFVVTADLNAVSDGIVYQTQDHVKLQFGWETVAKCFFSYRHEMADPDVRDFALLPGDVLFLCSDGVCKFIQTDILKDCLLTDQTAEQIADVIKSLCENNSRDNYSGIVIQIWE